MSAIRENRLFMGNPGAGKSTLINCLLGGNHMQSGLSWGGGLTNDYQQFKKDGIVYMDTPGLADARIQKEAADAITKALKQSGTYKLFFLVRLQNGRVVSDDLVTLERVLDSIDAGDLNYKYTIVMNCVGERQYKALVGRGDEFQMIKTLVNRRYLTESFCFIPCIKALEEKSNAIVQLPQEVCYFLENEAPYITVEERHIKPIALTGFAQQSQEIKSEIEKLRKDHAALLMAMKEQEKRHDETMKRMRASHAAELNQASKGPHSALAVPVTPRGNHDYVALPLTPPVDEPSTSWSSRQKRLVAVFIGVALVIAIVVGVVVVTQSKNSPTPTPTMAPSKLPPAPAKSNVTKPSVSLGNETLFLGCLTSEDMMGNRVYNRGSGGVNFSVALRDAVKGNKKYIAIARRLVDEGYTFVFDKLLTERFDGDDAGCRLPCPASRQFYCGCADDVCKDAGVKPGLRQSINRRWAVYERQKAK